MRDRRRVTVLALTLIIEMALCAIALSWPVQGPGNPQTEGALWLSWSAEARETYVAGYLRGFQQGKHVACAFYEENVAQKHPSRTQTPERNCMKSLPELTEPYHQAYVNRITEYFEKYPHDREAGLSTLMTNLATPPGLTVDQIHAKLSGGAN